MFEMIVSRDLPALEFLLREHEQTEEAARDGSWFRERAIYKSLLVYNSVFYDLDDAIADLDKAIELGDLRAFPYRLRGLLLLMKMTESPAASDAERKQIFERVRDDFQVGLEREPTDGYTRLCLIEASLLSHDWDDAIAAYGASRPFVQTPEEILIWSLLGCLALALGGETIEEEDARPLIEAQDRGKCLLIDFNDAEDWMRPFKRELKFKQGVLGPLLVRLRTLLLDELRSKPGYGERWRTANELMHRLIENLDVWHKYEMEDSIQKNRTKYEQTIELRSIDNIDVLEPILKVSREFSSYSSYIPQRITTDLEKALAINDKKIEVQPNAAAVWYERAIILGWLKSCEKKMVVLEKVVKVEPGHTVLGRSARFAKGNLLAQQKRYREALELFDEVIRLAGTDMMLKAVAWTKKANVLGQVAYLAKETKQEAEEQRFMEEALLAQERAIEVQPNFVDAWLDKAWTLSTLERHEEALEAFKKSILVRPYYAIMAGVMAPALRTKADSLRELHHYEEAIETYNLSMEFTVKRFRKEDLIEVGMLLEKLGRYEEALEAFNKAQEIEGERLKKLARSGYYGNEPKSLDIARICECKAAVYRKLGRYEEAIDAYDESIKNTSFNNVLISLWRQKAELLAQLNRHEEARQALEKVDNLSSEVAAK